LQSSPSTIPMTLLRIITYKYNTVYAAFHAYNYIHSAFAMLNKYTIGSRLFVVANRLLGLRECPLPRCLLAAISPPLCMASSSTTFLFPTVSHIPLIASRNFKNRSSTPGSVNPRYCVCNRQLRGVIIPQRLSVASNAIDHPSLGHNNNK
jgi:hypothetical protein